jgi:hypothetical protein
LSPDGHDYGRLQVPGGYGHTEVNSPTAAGDPKNIGRFEQVSNDHLGASGPQGRSPVVVAANHGANREPAVEQQAGHVSSNCAALTGCPGYEERSVIRSHHA